MKVHYPKLYNMAHLLALNVLLLPKDLTIIIIHLILKTQHFLENFKFSKNRSLDFFRICYESISMSLTSRHN